MNFKPNKEMDHLLDRCNDVIDKASDRIKDRIVKVCLKYNVNYNGFFCAFMDADKEELENTKTKEVGDYIDWFERVFHTIFDPQCYFEDGKWLGENS